MNKNNYFRYCLTITLSLIAILLPHLLQSGRRIVQFPTEVTTQRINSHQTAFFATSSGANHYSMALMHDGKELVAPLLLPEANGWTNVDVSIPTEQNNPIFNVSIGHNAHFKMNTQDIFCLSLTRNKNQSALLLLPKLDLTFSPIRNDFYLIPSIKDAYGTDQAHICALAAAGPTHIFACVAPIDKSFGEPGSGIAHLFYGPKVEKQEEQAEKTGDGDQEVALRKKLPNLFLQLDAHCARISETPFAIPFDGTLPFVKGDSKHAATIHALTGFIWDKSLRRFFITADVSTGPGSQDVASAVFVGKIMGKSAQEIAAGDHIGTLVLEEILPFSAVHTDSCIACRGASQRISVSHPVIFHSSTDIPYFICARSFTESTHAVIYALPLVSHTVDAGRIASIHETPQEAFFLEATKYFTHRFLEKRAIDQTDVPKHTDAAVVVGQYGLPGMVTSVRSIGDSIFAIVKTFDNAQLLVKSTAIFEASGKIIGWSIWQRIGIPVEKNSELKEIFFDEILGEFVFLLQSENAMHLYRTGWDSYEMVTTQNSSIGDQKKEAPAAMLDVIRTFGDQTDIRQVEHDDGIDYVMTDIGLYRIDEEHHTVDRIATAADPFFEDVLFTKFLVSNHFGLLATTGGLFEVQEGGSVRNGTCTFKKVIVPEMRGIPMSWSVITATGNPTDLARLCGGTILILFTDFRINQSRLYRFAVSATPDTVLAPRTMTLFNDLVLRGQKSSFLTFGKIQSEILYDGVRYFVSDGRVSSATPAKIGALGLGNKLEKFGENRRFISGFLLPTGNMLIQSEHGLQING